MPNYVQYFGSNIVGGIAEAEMSLVEVDGVEWRVEAEMSLVEVDGVEWRLGGAGWSWVELGARFSNTRFKKYC